ncbi:hypothetical protein FPV67DRAFT_1654173 [Lyophyllum atratum]|nr:hypothetical protein FPV67DRAFT_1654173 [Lyophyllum atratum]
METPLPGKVALFKETITVEESRAQRLQRQQARFRDRGGIFVPTNRNTLVDILLGRKAASPKKGRGRSTSVSPQKPGAKGDGEEDGGDGAQKTLRTSPRKAAQRRAEEERAVAGPSRLPASEPALKVAKASKPLSKKSTATATKTKTTTAAASKKGKAKAKSSETGKPVPTRRGRPPKTKSSNIDDEGPLAGAIEEDEPQQSKPKRPVKAPPTRASKKAGSTRTPSTAELPIEDDPLPELTTKAKAKRQTKSAAKRPSKKAVANLPEHDVDDVEDVDSAKGASRILDSRAQPGASRSLKQRSANSKVLDVDPPEDRRTDEPVVPKSSKKSKKSQLEDDSLAPSLVQKKGSQTDEEKAEIKITTKKVEKKAHEASAEVDDPPTKENGRKGKVRQLEDDDDESRPLETAKPSKPTRKRARPEPDTGSEVSKAKRTKAMSREEDEPPPDCGASRGKAQPKAVKKTAKRKKGDASEDVDEAVVEAPASPPSKKRVREPDKGEANHVKRAKIDGNGNGNSDKDVDDDVVAVKAKKASTKKSRARNAAPAKASIASKTSSHPKRALDSTLASIPKLRPRKSVMQRIKEPLPQIEDDEPDPINFLC